MVKKLPAIITVVPQRKSIPVNVIVWLISLYEIIGGLYDSSARAIWVNEIEVVNWYLLENVGVRSISAQAALALPICQMTFK